MFFAHMIIRVLNVIIGRRWFSDFQLSFVLLTKEPWPHMCATKINRIE